MYIVPTLERVTSVTLNQKLKLIKLSERGMSKVEIDQNLGLLCLGRLAVKAKKKS